MNIADFFHFFIATVQLHRHESFSREEIVRHQNAALRKLRKYALRHSPFYREFYSGKENSPLQELPVFLFTITKSGPCFLLP